MMRDPSFGPLVMAGLGGVFVEALRDVAFRIAPVSREAALCMLSSLRGVRMLDGMRGLPVVDRVAVADVIRRIGQMAMDWPDIAELDINPLLGTSGGVVALDARVSLRRS
jgi:acyl-CoA synthetase (NDP forming)